jgi:phosphoglycerate dehydrogenase-like enzyme
LVVTKLLFIASKKPNERIWVEPFFEALKEFGELTVVENGANLSEDQRADLIRRSDILLTGWQAAEIPVSVAEDRGGLQYICNVTGSLRKFLPAEIVEAGIPVTNWGDAPADRLAEGAAALLLAMLKDLVRRARNVREGGWKAGQEFYAGTLDGLNLGIYGFGVIGRRFETLIRPFRPVVRVYDPYVADIPETCERVESLEELFERSEAIAVHAGLSDETEGSITAELLTKLPDHGLLINTARGAIFDQDALFAELESGRLRAGLDVLQPDRLPDGHPARQLDNVVFTAHNVGKVYAPPGAPPRLEDMHRICLENLRRHRDGEPLKFLMDKVRYERST